MEGAKLTPGCLEYCLPNRIQEILYARLLHFTMIYGNLNVLLQIESSSLY